MSELSELRKLALTPPIISSDECLGLKTASSFVQSGMRAYWFRQFCHPYSAIFQCQPVRHIQDQFIIFTRLCIFPIHHFGRERNCSIGVFSIILLCISSGFGPHMHCRFVEYIQAVDLNWILITPGALRLWAVSEYKIMYRTELHWTFC